MFIIWARSIGGPVGTEGRSPSNIQFLQLFLGYFQIVALEPLEVLVVGDDGQAFHPETVIQIFNPDGKCCILLHFDAFVGLQCLRNHKHMCSQISVQKIIGSPKILLIEVADLQHSSFKDCQTKKSSSFRSANSILQLSRISGGLLLLNT